MRDSVLCSGKGHTMRSSPSECHFNRTFTTSRFLLSFVVGFISWSYDLEDTSVASFQCVVFGNVIGIWGINTCSLNMGIFMSAHWISSITLVLYLSACLYTQRLLDICFKINKWLRYLCYSQLHTFPLKWVVWFCINCSLSWSVSKQWFVLCV